MLNPSKMMMMITMMMQEVGKVHQPPNFVLQAAMVNTFGQCRVL